MHIPCGKVDELRVPLAEREERRRVEIRADAFCRARSEEAMADEQDDRKEAAKEGAEFVEDKAVKIVQVFQGLCTSGDSGIQYDSLDAKLMNETRGAVVFQLPSASSSSSSSAECTEYLLTAEGIFPNDCLCLDLQALPRLVTEGAFDVNAATPFGESLHMQNAFMLGDRKGPNFIVPRGTSQEHVQMMALRARSEALCNAHGRLLTGGFWNTSRVAKSSPP